MALPADVIKCTVHDMWTDCVKIVKLYKVKMHILELVLINTGADNVSDIVVKIIH